MMAQVKRILLVEDSPQDIELTMGALDECHLANQVDVAHDGQEALDYLHRRGSFADQGRRPGNVTALDCGFNLSVLMYDMLQLVGSSVERRTRSVRESPSN